MMRKPSCSPAPLGDKHNQNFCCSLFFVTATLQRHMLRAAVNTLLRMSDLIYSVFWKENKECQFLNTIMTMNSSCLKIAQTRD